MRNALFQKAVAGVTVEEQAHTLTPISALLGTDDGDDDMGSDVLVVLAMLTQLEEDCFYLEDQDGKVRIDVSETQFNMGLFTEQCIVIVLLNYGVISAANQWNYVP